MKSGEIFENVYYQFLEGTPILALPGIVQDISVTASVGNDFRYRDKTVSLTLALIDNNLDFPLNRRELKLLALEKIFRFSDRVNKLILLHPHINSRGIRWVTMNHMSTVEGNSNDVIIANLTFVEWKEMYQNLGVDDGRS